MALTIDRSVVLTQMASLVADFLPASFNNTTSFPIAAQNAGVAKFWSYEGGKRGSVARMFKLAYESDSKSLLRVVKQIVDLGFVYRSRSDKEPITRQEIESLNALLLKLGLRIKSLNDPSFLSSLPGVHAKVNDKSSVATKARRPNETERAELKDSLLAIASLPNQERGYAFEGFLNRLFDLHGMSPKAPFRNRGEQIDGSFAHGHEVFLLEARWRDTESAVRDLYVFASKVETKAAWARGLFISQSGFTEDGLFAFRQGKPTSIVCMDGLDLYSIIEHRLDLAEVLDQKKRSAVETGRAFVSISEIYPRLRA